MYGAGSSVFGRCRPVVNALFAVGWVERDIRLLVSRDFTESEELDVVKCSAQSYTGPTFPCVVVADVEDWSAEQVADWLLTVSPDSAYIDYAETFKRMYNCTFFLNYSRVNYDTNNYVYGVVNYSGHRIRGANLPRLDFRLLGCMGIESIGHQIDILQVRACYKSILCFQLLLVCLGY